MDDWQHIKLTYITHFYCNQGNIDSVLSLLRLYESYPEDILNSTHFVIVDDCSNIHYEVPEFKLNLTWLRIDDDIAWNQGGARNLGVTYAKSDKILITDLDHHLPPETFSYLIRHKNPDRKFYKIYRNDAETGKRIKGHSNLFFMSRARFFRHFGYDEEFCGHYGAEDYRFVKYHKYHGSVQRYLPRHIRCNIRNIDRENSYHSLQRDLSFNTPVDLKKANEISTYGAERGHSRNFLNFKWHTVAVFNRPDTPPKPRRLWRSLWWFRCLFSPLAR
ncbi:Glycosyl transferase family 2 [Izhakiella capsodis]|uniref:Glycosyl transferase family 2 n=1 Tax=Izhakiella capsodis TaxID=1367852 RepID=A0A1I4V5D0_9GAMM|nr:glycosyltransferase family A protein [Izhakiella capsodis]SFM96378.1 Glycosyl transferase family 2 [Izhakiella capsodis]